MDEAVNCEDPDYQVDVSFSLRSELLVPNEVTMRLGIQPSRAFAKGESYQRRTGVRQHPWGLWVLSTEGKLSTNIAKDHAEYLANILEPKRAVISSYLEDPNYIVSIRIDWQTKYAEGGYTLPSRLLARLGLLCNDFDMVFLAKNED